MTFHLMCVIFESVWDSIPPGLTLMLAPGCSLVARKQWGWGSICPWACAKNLQGKASALQHAKVRDAFRIPRVENLQNVEGNPGKEGLGLDCAFLLLFFSGQEFAITFIYFCIFYGVLHMGNLSQLLGLFLPLHFQWMSSLTGKEYFWKDCTLWLSKDPLWVCCFTKGRMPLLRGKLCNSLP